MRCWIVDQPGRVAGGDPPAVGGRGIALGGGSLGMVILAAAIWLVSLALLIYLAHRISRPIQQLTAGLGKLGLRVFPSAANFVLVDTVRGEHVVGADVVPELAAERLAIWREEIRPRVGAAEDGVGAEEGVGDHQPPDPRGLGEEAVAHRRVGKMLEAHDAVHQRAGRIGRGLLQERPGQGQPVLRPRLAAAHLHERALSAAEEERAAGLSRPQMVNLVGWHAGGAAFHVYLPFHPPAG